MARQVYGRKRNAKRVLRASGKSPELHCMIVPTDPYDLLLPTSVVAEVIDYAEPEPMEIAPPWLMGHIEWADRQVPLFSFGALINGADMVDIPRGSRIMILKSLNRSGRVPWLGLLLHGLPRPVTIKPQHLVETGDEKKSLGVFRRVALEDQEVIVPDIDRLTHLVTHAAFGALPITQLDR
jgi:chemosensory pili system protein ChpC